MIRPRNIFIVLFLVVCLVLQPAAGQNITDSCDKQDCLERLRDDPNDLAALQGLCVASMKELDFDGSVGYARRMLQVTRDAGRTGRERIDRLYALAFAGQAFAAADKYDQALNCLNRGIRLLGEVEPILDEEHALPVYILHNSLGICLINRDMDYERAIRCFIGGLEAARRYPKNDRYAILVHNLVVSYFILENPDGLKYALELYDYGCASDNLRLRYMGAYGAAMMYTLLGDYASAERYVREALSDPKTNMDVMGTNNLYAIILNATGRGREAERHFRTALEYLDIESATTAVFTCLSYGNYLADRGDYAQAVAMFNRGLAISDARHNKTFLYKLYRSLAAVHKRHGDYARALADYERYHMTKDSIFTIKKERTINELELKYNTARQEAKLSEYELQLQRKSHIIQAAGIVTLAVLVILTILYVMYRNKNKMYMTIARRYKEAVERIRAAEEEASGHGAAPVPAGGRSDEIFGRVERLMAGDRIFKDPMLTRERVAELTGTNRTYLSRAISEKTGKTFNQYVSALRIAEAISILSDAACRLPLKTVAEDAGFCSQSNFFKLFKEEVGMTPAKYREKIIELSKQQKTAPEHSESED